MRRKYPLQTVVLETTNRCNLNCLICGSDAENKVNSNELSAQEWCDVIDEMAALGLKKSFSAAESRH